MVNQRFKDQIKLVTAFRVGGDGTVAVRLNLDADESLPDLIRFGVTMGVTDVYRNVSFYGRGPWENYADRKRGTWIDEFAMKTDSLFHPYPVPQESGNHTETRWLILSADENHLDGLRYQGMPTFDFSVWPYSADGISAAKHPHDLARQGFYTVNIDRLQAGLGGTLSHTLPQYIPASGKHELSFSMSPMRSPKE